MVHKSLEIPAVVLGKDMVDDASDAIDNSNLNLINPLSKNIGHIVPFLHQKYGLKRLLLSSATVSVITFSCES